jgi:hypothetical protein
LSDRKRRQIKAVCQNSNLLSVRQAVLRPIKGLQRELDQAGVHGGDPGKLFARFSDQRAIVMQNQHPGFEPLVEITLRNGIRERMTS